MGADSATLRNTFSTLISSATSPAPFAAAGSAHRHLPNPFLRVAGLPDPLAQPAPPAQIVALLALPAATPLPRPPPAPPASPASAVDADVTVGPPHTHVVSAEHIAFHNPRWYSGLTALTAHIRDQLAVRPPITAQFSGMLVQAAGASVPPRVQQHLNSSPHVFAALVLTLPCLHEGGALHMRHGRQKLVLQSAGDEGSFEIQYAAFYFGCEHELQVVTSGYRISLVYHLVVTDTSAPLPLPPLMHGFCVDELRNFGQKWSVDALNTDTLNKMCFFLDDVYAVDVASSWDSLVGRDASAATVLHDAGCFDMALVQIQGPVLCPSSGRIIENSLTSYFNTNVTCSENTSIAELSLDVRVDEFVQGYHFFMSSSPGRTELPGLRIDNFDLMYVRTAIVLWPKPMLVTAVGDRTAAQNLLDTVIKEGQLCGCNDIDEFVIRFLKRRDDFEGNSHRSILEILPDERVSVKPAQMLLKRLHFVLLERDFFLPKLAILVARHGLSALKDALIEMLQVPVNSRSEPAVCAGWRLLRDMQSYQGATTSEGKQILQDIAHTLVPHLQQSLQPWSNVVHLSHYLSGTVGLQTRESTIQAVFTCLQNLDCPQLLEVALDNIAYNTNRFAALTVIGDTLPKLLELNNNVPSPQLKKLAHSVLISMPRDSQEAVSEAYLSRILNILLPFDLCKDAVAEAMKRPLVYSPLRCVFWTLVHLWKVSRAACNSHFAFYAGVIIRCVRDATTDESETNKRAIIADGLLILGEMDKLSLSDVQSDTSYQLQFAQALTKRGEIFSERTTAHGILLALDSDTNVADEAASILLSRGISSVQEDAAIVVQPFKDWSVKTPTSFCCRCQSCQEVVSFLENPLSEMIIIAGRNATHKGHTAQKISSASFERGAEFSTQFLTSAATTVNGRMRIRKKSGGRTPSKELPTILALVEKQKEAAALLKKLEEKYDGVKPVVDLDNPRSPKRARATVVIEV